jgi:hypothetical protein
MSAKRSKSQLAAELQAVVDLFTRLQKQHGFGAVKEIANKALRLIRAKAPSRRKSGPHRLTREFVEEWETNKSRELMFKRASPAKLAGWIANLHENLRQGKTDLGAPITPELAEAIRTYIADLEERRSNLSTEKITRPRKGEIHSELAEQFVESNIYGRPRGDQDAASYIREKLKRGRRSIRRGGQKQNRSKI